MKLLLNSAAFTPPVQQTDPAEYGIGGCDYYAAPDGVPGNTGTHQASPWNLQKALTSSLVNGKTLGLLAGTYRGKFVSTLNNATVRGCNPQIIGTSVIDGYVYTTLTFNMTTGNTGSSITFEVGSATAFQTLYTAGAINSLIINGEAFFITGISGNNVTALRGAAGTYPEAQTTQPAHAAGTLVRAAGNQLLIKGNNSTYIGLECTNSDPARNWLTDGGEGLRGNGVFITGENGNNAVGNTVANCYLHDNLNGISTGSDSASSQVTGNLIVNNGMYFGASAKGHGGYFENKLGFSYIYDNIFLNNFNEGFQCYGRSAPYPGGRVIGNASANSGSPISAIFRVRNAIIGPESIRLPDILVSDNCFFQPQNLNAGNMTFGYGFGADNGTIQNNYFVGGGALMLEVISTTACTVTGNKVYTSNNSGINAQAEQKGINYTWNNNTYYGTATNADKFGNLTAHQNQTFALWKNATTYDVNSTITTAALPTTVTVRPNAFESGRANIYVYAQGQTSVQVDLSQAGLPVGVTIRIYNAFNYITDVGINYVYEGVYTGSSVILPLNTANATAVVTPVGGTSTPATTLPNFGAFILVSLPTS